MIVISYVGFFSLFLLAANWLQNECDRSLKEWMDPRDRLLYHSLVAFFKVVGKTRQSWIIDPLKLHLGAVTLNVIIRVPTPIVSLQQWHLEMRDVSVVVM